MPNSDNGQKEVSTDSPDYTLKSIDRQENISAIRQRSKVVVEIVLSTNVENVRKNVKIAEYGLISGHSTVDNVQYDDDENTDIIEFDGPEKMQFFKMIKL